MTKPKNSVQRSAKLVLQHSETT